MDRACALLVICMIPMLGCTGGRTRAAGTGETRSALAATTGAGDPVATPRGAGRIRQGYASGAVIQYEIEGAGGALFMASQHEVRRTADTRQ